MLPYITILGRLHLPTLGLLLLLGAFWGSFSFYRLLHHNARYNEFEIFDALIVATISALIVGRLTDIVYNWPIFGLNWRAWLNFPVYPGLCVPAFLLAGGTTLAFYLRRVLHLADWEILDYWARGTCLFLTFYYLGLLAAGQGTGFIAENIFGLRFPPLSLPVYPVPMYQAIFYFSLYFILGALEKNYRTFDWYRAGRSQAKTGFIFLTFIVAYGLFSLITTCWLPAKYTAFGYNLDVFIGLFFVILSLVLIYTHALYLPRPKSVKKSKNKNAR